MSMPLRIKIARWLAPEWSKMEQDHAFNKMLAKHAHEALGSQNNRFYAALNAIAARNTPNASHTVKKIVAMAEEALR